MRRLLATALLGSFLATPVAAQGSTLTASWYGHHWAGRHTASGERFNPHALTAASRTLPLGTHVRVSYQERSVVVRINDRGPRVRGRGLDLSEAAANTLGMRHRGVARVHVEVLKLSR